jgi:FAD synthetase
MLGTVLLHLFAGALARRSSSPPKPIPALYVPVPSPFPVLETFIQSAAAAYDLDLFHCVPRPTSSTPVESVDTPDVEQNTYLTANGHKAEVQRPVGKSKGGEGMRRGLELYQKQFPNITAILVGTRRTDPHGGKVF